MKADTMNEKTIELPPLSIDDMRNLVRDSGLDWQSGWVLDGEPNRFAQLLAATWHRAAILADRASRPRAASEPGEVRDAFGVVWGRPAIRATSPASEVQAGAICRENYALVPVRKRPSCCDRGRDLSGGVSEECCGNGNCSQDEEEARARASWLAAALPASSPVAAEGQKAALTHEQITKFGLGLEYVHSVLRWAACGYVHTPERIASLHTSYRIVDRIINATPTASMADAAEAVAPTSEEEVAVTQDDVDRARELILNATATDLLSGGRKVIKADRATVYGWLLEAAVRLTGDVPSATPGPRGENAGGASDAARDVLDERARQISVEGWTPAHDDEHSSGEMASAAGAYALYVSGRVQRAKAEQLWPWDLEWFKPDDTRRALVKAGALILAEIERFDRGLRIAEKGDARAIISAEPWLKSGEVRDRLEDGK